MHPLVEQKLPQIAELCRRYHVRRLDLFGSATGGQFDLARSDVDFVLEFLPEAKSHYPDAYFGLKEELERLLGREVDLVMIKAVRNRDFREELEETRVQLYAA